MSTKNEDYLSWDEYFMAVAFLAAKRSKDPCTQVGACVVNEKKIIVGIGYNGMPTGCNDDDYPWGKDGPSELEKKFLYVCHAEVNAILNKNCASLDGCTMYVALFPCNECAKFIIQSGIKKVMYMSDKNAEKIGTIAAKRMFDSANVQYTQYIPNKKIVIDFSQLPATPAKKRESPSTSRSAANGVSPPSLDFSEGRKTPKLD